MDTATVTPRVDARAEYTAATEKVGFTKDFNPSLEALMMDPTATYGQRFMAWLKRRSWGNYRLYAVLESGEPATQADCSRELGIEKRCISNVVAFYEERGYLYRKGKLLYPTITPQVPPLPEKSLAPLTFLQFIEHWKVTCSADFLALEVARSEVERLRKVQIAAYKKWLALQTNGAPTLYEKEEIEEREDPPPPQPSVSLPEPEEEEEATQSMVRLPEPPAPAVLEAEFVPEEPTFQEFAKDYPGEVDPDSKPAYEALKPEDKAAIREALPKFKACERWRETPRFIPMASNFLKKRAWEFPPPRARTIESPRMEKSRQEAQNLVGMLKAMRRAPS